MSTTTGDLRPATTVNWRTPLVIIICGCVIGLLSFGPRSSLGFFVQPMSREFAWGRDVFGFALALQNLLWGLGQPIAGAIADRFGVFRVMAVGALLYAGGLLLMRYSSTPLSLDIGAGVLIGFGLSGSPSISCCPLSASCCRRSSAVSRSAPARRPDHSASSCSRHSAWQ